MSTFRVTTAAVNDAAHRIGGISGHVLELHGRLDQHQSAGHGTPAGASLTAVIGRWAATLPTFALAGDHLAGAVGGAAAAYQNSDNAVADGCRVDTSDHPKP